MRLSRVPVLSLYRRDLVYDPGGLRHGSPWRRAVAAFQPNDTVRCSLQKDRSSFPPLIPCLGPPLSNNFRGSIQTPTTRLARLLTFISSGQRVRLPGCWLGFALGRTCTSWIALTDFIEGATLEFQQLRA